MGTQVNPIKVLLLYIIISVIEWWRTLPSVSYRVSRAFKWLIVAVHYILPCSVAIVDYPCSHIVHKNISTYKLYLVAVVDIPM